MFFVPNFTQVFENIKNIKYIMDTLSYKTISSKSSTVNKEWFLVDGNEQIVGRFSSKIAKILRGKHKAYFSPHVDCGDNVVIINAEKIKFTGKKLTDKKYIRYTGYPGGQRETTPEKILNTKPKLILEKSIKGMLPKNKLGRKLFHNVFIYEGTKHPHEAQQLKNINLNKI